MNDLQWKIFCDFKAELKNQVEKWQNDYPELTHLQERAAQDTQTPPYPFETSVVYNRDLDKLTQEDDIRLIVIGDNPGKDEQLSKNNRYLVGQAGKIAEGFFKRNPDLNVDFRKNVIILNKTPVHSAKTSHLKLMMKYGGQRIENLINESQLWMAKKTAALHIDLIQAVADGKGDRLLCTPELWLVGYSELKEKGFFVPYKNCLKETYAEKAEQRGQTPNESWNKVFVFQHFSMNRFSINLKEYLEANGEEKITLSAIHQLGIKHKEEIFQ